MNIETDKGHFRITFQNGYTLSVFNGYGSYSDNYFNRNYISYPNPINDKETLKYINQSVKSNNCEIAIINPKGNMITNDILHCGDSVMGYVDVAELVKIINITNELEKTGEITTDCHGNTIFVDYE